MKVKIIELLNKVLFGFYQAHIAMNVKDPTSAAINWLGIVIVVNGTSLGHIVNQLITGCLGWSGYSVKSLGIFMAIFTVASCFLAGRRLDNLIKKDYGRKFCKAQINRLRKVAWVLVFTSPLSVLMSVYLMVD